MTDLSVPPAAIGPPSSIEALVAFVAAGPVAVLAGAGLSTDSGIPDYRGPASRGRTRSPVRYDDFVADTEARRRYWARASRGWARMADAAPNAGHRALAALEAAGHVLGTITQNVDGLGRRAGSQRVVEIHGALREVVCLDCETLWPRDTVQAHIEALNPGWLAGADDAPAPDGDAETAEAEIAAFHPPACRACGGVLKPDVVFFGESVPKARVRLAQRLVSETQALLVVGSSLTVYSGYRFVRQAETEGRPVAIVTLGETRGHRHAALALDAPLGEVLPALADALGT